MPDDFTIIIDNREQRPFFYSHADSYAFPGLSFQFGTLQTGDYSISGYTSPDCKHSICVERKSLADLFGSMGRGRERLEREFIRMHEFDYAALIIEADLRTIIKDPPIASSMNPKSVFRSLLAFSQRYNIHVWPCPSRIFAERCTYLILKRFWDDRQPCGKLYDCMEGSANEG